MPLYEYECNKCGHRTEVIQRFSDPAPAKCTECDGAMSRLISAPAVQFKGSGWYVNDYARKKGASPDGDGAKAAKSEGGAAKDDGGKSEAPKSKDSDSGDTKKPAVASTSA